MHILIIEDNRDIAANLYDYLERQGHDMELAHDGARGLQVAMQQTFDAILLDIGLPKVDGLSICRKLREEAGADTPILILSARDTLQDKLAGFASGADDYVVKPFSLEEIGARLAALNKRRQGTMARRTSRAGDLSYDHRTKQASFCGNEVMLTPKCTRLLELMIGEPGRVFSRRELEIELWGEAQETSDRLRQLMHLLRSALTKAGGRDPIRTMQGMGYCLS